MVIHTLKYSALRHRLSTAPPACEESALPRTQRINFGSAPVGGRRGFDVEWLPRSSVTVGRYGVAIGS